MKLIWKGLLLLKSVKKGEKNRSHRDAKALKANYTMYISSVGPANNWPNELYK